MRTTFYRLESNRQQIGAKEKKSTEVSSKIEEAGSTIDRVDNVLNFPYKYIKADIPEIDLSIESILERVLQIIKNLGNSKNIAFKIVPRDKFDKRNGKIICNSGRGRADGTSKKNFYIPEDITGGDLLSSLNVILENLSIDDSKLDELNADIHEFKVFLKYIFGTLLKKGAISNGDLQKIIQSENITSNVMSDIKNIKVNISDIRDYKFIKGLAEGDTCDIESILRQVQILTVQYFSEFIGSYFTNEEKSIFFEKIGHLFLNINLNTKMAKKALCFFKLVSEVDSNNIYALRNIGYCYGLMNKYEDAFTYYAKLLKTGKANKVYLEEALYVFEETGNQEMIIMCLLLGLKNDEKNIDYLIFIGDYYSENRDISNAFECYLKAYKVDISNLYALGKVQKLYLKKLHIALAKGNNDWQEVIENMKSNNIGITSEVHSLIGKFVVNSI